LSAPELVDIVDGDDRVVGRATRSEMRHRQLLHRCVYILLFNSARQLFVHCRTNTKDIYPGFWDVAIGGVVLAGEGYDDAARREVEEEVGLARVELFRLFPVVYEDQRTRVRGMAYRCTSDQPLRLQIEELAEGRWVNRGELEELIEHESFCPDGLAVLGIYLRQTGGQGALRF
jgi:isopentenyldiphosphate isomerase